MLELKISFTPEAEQLLTRLLNAVDVLQTAPAPAEEQKTEAPTPVAEPVTAEVAPVAPVKIYSLDEVRARVMTLSRKSPELKAQVKDILTQWAPTVPKLPPEHYGDFMQALDALDALEG